MTPLFYEIYMMYWIDAWLDNREELSDPVSQQRWKQLDMLRQLAILNRMNGDEYRINEDLAALYARPLYKEYLARFKKLVDAHKTHPANIIEPVVWEKSPPLGLEHTLAYMDAQLQQHGLL